MEAFRCPECYKCWLVPADVGDNYERVLLVCPYCGYEVQTVESKKFLASKDTVFLDA